MLGFGGNQNKRCGPIGVALASTMVRLAQRLPDGSFALEAEPLPQGVDPSSPAYHTETQRAIETAIRRGSFVGKNVVSALPAESVIYKTLRLPPMPPEELAQAVAWEATERLKVNDDQSIQFYLAGEVNQGNETREELVLLAAEKQTIYDHASAIKRAGLTPTAIDATGAALARLFGEPDATAAVIHTGTDTAEIIGVRNGSVIFDKPVAMVGPDQSIDTTAFAREIGLCLRYLSVTFGVHKPGTLWLCGDHAEPALASELSDKLNQTVKTTDQHPAMQSVDWAAAEAGRWAVAMGLAEQREQSGNRRGAA